MLLARQVAQETDFSQNLGTSGLTERHVRIDGAQTVLRLESAIWEGLDGIARREGATLDDLCAMVAGRAGADGPDEIAAALRLFVLSYLLRAAFETPGDAASEPRGKLRDRVRHISDRVARLPDLDTRSPEEIVGFDERGLFS